MIDTNIDYQALGDTNAKRWTVTDNTSAGDDAQGYPWPGFVGMGTMRTLLTGLQLRGFGVTVILDLTRRTVDADGVVQRLDVAELLVLGQLVGHRGDIVLREHLATTLSASNRVGVRSVDAIVGQIRAKLGRYGGIIETHYARGYSLRPGEDIEVRNFDP